MVPTARVALYPGTFDPIHYGHLDVIERASTIFDQLIVTVFVNSQKHPLFNADERVDLVRQAVRNFANVEVEQSSQLLVAYAEARRVDVVIRGLRAVLDFDYEFQIALMNKKLQPRLETIFMLTNERYSYLSSTIAKELASYHADVRELVPDFVRQALAEKYASQRP